MGQLIYQPLKAKSWNLLVENLSKIYKSFYQEDLSSLGFFLNYRKEKILTFLDEISSSDEDFYSEEIFDYLSKCEHSKKFLSYFNRFPFNEASLKALNELNQECIQINQYNLNDDNLKNLPAFILSKVQLKTKPRQEKIFLDEESCIYFISNDKKNFSEHLQRLVDALQMIKTHSPSSYERVKRFTRFIIPIKQEELVSYSHQDMPGISFINLYNRDFLDLMDDIVHENGHHHLNYYLNQEELINEKSEELYHSPWRNSLRPLRGIYHAYFTFYWAYYLFNDLLNLESSDFPKNYPIKKNKVLKRRDEEIKMLSESLPHLKEAYKAGDISPNGMKLIKNLSQSIAAASD